MSEKGLQAVAQAVKEALISPNVGDSNGEAANLVDVIEDVALALRRGLVSEARKNEVSKPANVADGLFSIADAIRDLAGAVRAGVETGRTRNVESAAESPVRRHGPVRRCGR